MTTSQRLRSAIYVNQDVADTAEHIAWLLDRDYKCFMVNFFIDAPNLHLGEIARALALQSKYDNVQKRYSVMIEDGPITVLISGPVADF